MGELNVVDIRNVAGAVKKQLDPIDKKIDRVQQRLDDIDSRLKKIEQGMATARGK